MTLAIVTTAYQGYGVFVRHWLDAVAEMDPAPDQVVVALGPGHRLDGVSRLGTDYRALPLDVVETRQRPLVMGMMRNVAVKKTSAAWVMYVSADDIVLPDAIRILRPAMVDADYVCISWLSRDTWLDDPPDVYHRGRTPREMAENAYGHGFIVGHSPFRRRFWKLGPYANHDYPNAPFVAGVIRNGGRFTKTVEPCTVYLRRADSHAKRLGRRGAKPVRSEKAQASRYKRELEGTIRRYCR